MNIYHNKNLNCENWTIRFVKTLLGILILFLFLTKPSQADDIKDFQIEGMSIGDSLLDYFSKSEIKKNVQTDQYPASDKYIINTINLHKSFKLYEMVQVDYLKNDKKFIIASLAGSLFIENIERCYTKQKEIEKEISEMFPSAEKRSGVLNKSFDKTGRSTSTVIEYYLPSKDMIQIACDDWTEEITKKHNFPDLLMISLMSKDYRDFLLNEAY